MVNSPIIRIRMTFVASHRTLVALGGGLRMNHVISARFSGGHSDLRLELTVYPTARGALSGWYSLADSR